MYNTTSDKTCFVKELMYVSRCMLEGLFHNDRSLWNDPWDLLSEKGYLLLGLLDFGGVYLRDSVVSGNNQSLPLQVKPLKPASFSCYCHSGGLLGASRSATGCAQGIRALNSASIAVHPSPLEVGILWCKISAFSYEFLSHTQVSV